MGLRFRVTENIWCGEIELLYLDEIFFFKGNFSTKKFKKILSLIRKLRIQDRTLIQGFGGAGCWPARGAEGIRQDGADTKPKKNNRQHAGLLITSLAFM